MIVDIIFILQIWRYGHMNKDSKNLNELMINIE